MTELLESSQAIVLGGGLSVTPDGQTLLGPDSQARTDRAKELYFSNPASFNRAGSVIVCTGSSTPLSGDRYSLTEASLMADSLIHAGVPLKLIETEETSTNTLTNFLNSGDLLEDKAVVYNGDTLPILSVVTQDYHYRPRARFLGSKCLNRPMQNAVAQGEAGLRRKGQELALYNFYRTALFGIQAGDRAAIRERATVITKTISLLRAPLSRVWQ